MRLLRIGLTVCSFALAVDASASPAAPMPSKRARAQAMTQLSGRALLDAARGESDANLHQMALARLLTDKTLDKTARRETLRLVRDAGRGLLPKRPLVPRKGPIEVRYYIGDEFYRDEVALLRQKGFAVTESGSKATATRGRLNVVVSGNTGNVFEDLSNPKVHAVIYSGHSNLGGIVEQGLGATAGKTPRGTKLIGLFQCKGTQTLPLLEQRMPNAHVIATYNYSHGDADQAGIHAILDGLEHGHNYARIRRQTKAATHDWKNYLFPDQVASLAHLDLDKNGRLDAPQVANEAWGPTTLDRRGRGAASRMMSGVHYLRTANPYYQEENRDAVFSRTQANFRVRALGVVSGDGNNVTQVREANGAIEVALDKKFANASRAFVGAATVYELQQFFQRKQLGPGADARKVQARTLTFVGDYLRRMVPNARAADAAFEQLKRTKGLAPSLRLSDVQPWTMHGLEQHVERVSTLLAQ